MTLTVTISKGDIPAPQVVSPATVVEKSGEPQALGVTIPIILVDLTAVSFKQRSAGGNPEFAFDFGTMAITLRQEVYLASDLTPCAQRKWAAHERGHVNDNRAIMDQLQAAFMEYGIIKDVFVNGVWYPRSDFSTIQRLIREEVGAAFLDLTAAAAARHDSLTEYRRVAREILRDCPDPIMYTVQRGDTLSAIALHHYGMASRWKILHDANLAVIGSNPSLIRVGQQIRIPKV